ncbi:DUF418 domain-containing protein [Pseudorhodoferax sp. Leaf267]|uniref:DUF418 domain-containing protein n=1 Tax=Pseudorhodoferax sp. Leaf267 TaxID=1736316 RepID=UPI0006FFF222|nr:DUF418 domain-containing protein [Pseudorhodoferax sp. Leaf267]KQP14992.1 hypothetical protein ASF43_13145 [Pseudorhodoferax sp. Leaf267]
MRTPLHRETLPDTVRALAMVSVLVLNAIGYPAAPWGPMLGERMPQDSALAGAVQGLVGALLQGKGMAMLAFVFGMSAWLAARGRDRPAARRRALVRNRRLLGLGIVHGLFVYFGDILTLYALLGRLLLRRLHLPWRRFRRHLWRTLAWALLAKLVFLALLLLPPLATEEPELTSLATARGAWEFLQLNALAYGTSQLVGAILAAPVVYLCMACGVAGARLRLLTHRRWRPTLRRGLRRSGPVLLGLSVLYGWGCAVTQPWDLPRIWIDAAGDVIALPVAACYLAALALASSGGRAHWCRWLSPLGQRTLTLYVGHSLLCLALFSGAGLAMALSTAQMVLACLGWWLLALLAAAHSTRRWPLETWMGRR